MRGSIKFEEIWKKKLDMQFINLGISLERKINLLNDDFESLYNNHYEFKANHRNTETLLDLLEKTKRDVAKYEDILKRYIKYQGEK